MRSHESIYGLLGTYMKESERYSLALITQPGREGGEVGMVVVVLVGGVGAVRGCGWIP